MSWAGLVAGSIALVGFGLDSAIEGLASVDRGVAVHRLVERCLPHSERALAQLLVAVSFFLLAPYVALESLRSLMVEHHAGDEQSSGSS